ncbi:MAG: tRNA (adenosine(37)-N6)-dimethylallyltransferase MiaA [Pigeon pea little leaf phytoplasma]|uniref:tRNA dimethylallyltransferase n=1 Tax=Candidatus Phytoplasma fabacearum TaxID=2982628 RepID=A0ABU8ZSI3_9MOLU|nr:tRNA (adenosine(37)-N6)-dimethylallyltransferase MiaA ['Bituminaria bituminosa' little leaf phytoplasma]MDV3153953.1 tRNA (adenosine(37)-N6)-dimethylallyltransferase MiaA [Pigeon pea little leaf phytoplasma]MDO7983594.1 tRNA (adenosine(37)-N6)-dimethylallyltransferase MiaA ['Bituminaria bituminosa' little leaf phytoplasma]MDO8023749.1 tRNA (adenosine(37)-N6)-dimethylallyltransferase MiaA ['Bituminaria bituminosa' little leaf phytoplasma]MDO8030432.1 tRNA (adenosine(37)-N6)-dimethylallyltrans
MNNKIQKKIIVIVGPTASGKTSLSLKLANFFRGEIINADAVQIYKEFNIGSSKISLQDTHIPHHLLDIVNPGEKYNIFDFQRDARNIIFNIKVPFVVGGSGLYIKAALFDYELFISKDYENKSYQNVNLEYMLKVIFKKDPNLVIDIKNPRRVISAYRQALCNSLRSQKNGSNKPLFNILTIYLNIDPQFLKQRIILRLDQMLKQGFIGEVQYLINKYPNANFNIIGYREMKEFLEQKISFQQAYDLIITKTLKYAKRQKTWFMNQMLSLVQLESLDPELETKAIDIIKKFLKKR